jgi:hypothetical protein
MYTRVPIFLLVVVYSAEYKIQIFDKTWLQQEQTFPRLSLFGMVDWPTKIDEAWGNSIYLLSQ